jgi:transposase
MEASGHARWFERLLAELRFELWIGDAAEIRTQTGTQAKKRSPGCPTAAAIDNGRSFSAHLGAELGESRSTATAVAPAPDGAGMHGMMNQLQAVALNEGLRCKKRLWREGGRQQLESFRLAPWASRRRGDLLELLDRLNPTIAELSQAIEQEVEKCPEARRLMTQPGVGPLTALAFVLIIGEAERFRCGKQIASYLG